jgi:TolA-binding protein
VSSEPNVRDLLAPLAEQDVDPASRRFQVDREKVISRMVEVSLTPETRFSARARVGMALALAAGFALAAWGGLRAFEGQSAAAASRIEVLVLRGKVTGRAGTLAVGQAQVVARDGSLETSEHAEARINTGAGLTIDLLENTKVSLQELGAGASSALRLNRGRVRCVIPHEPGRVFSVVTADVRVVDIGTVFSVAVEPSAAGSKTAVHVEEGEVLVEHAGSKLRLRAPGSWSSVDDAPAAAEPAPIVETPPAEAAPTPSARREASLPTRHRATLAAETQLLQSGLASEQRGDFQAAARSFELLVARYPGSPLAPDARSALSRVKSRLESPK